MLRRASAGNLHDDALTLARTLPATAPSTWPLPHLTLDSPLCAGHVRSVLVVDVSKSIKPPSRSVVWVENRWHHFNATAAESPSCRHRTSKYWDAIFTLRENQACCNAVERKHSNDTLPSCCNCTSFGQVELDSHRFYDQLADVPCPQTSPQWSAPTET